MSNRTAVLETNKGTIKFELLEQDAPKTTENFRLLAEKNYYDGVIFHREWATPLFVIQIERATGCRWPDKEISELPLLPALQALGVGDLRKSNLLTPPTLAGPAHSYSFLQQNLRLI